MSLLGAFRRSEQRSTLDSWDVSWGSASAQNVNEVTAFNLSAVWACQTLIADAIATMPVDTFRKTGDIREPTTPPAWVDTPNNEGTRVDYDTSRVLSLLGWGNAFSLLTRKGGTSDPLAPVLQRQIIDPWRVNVTRTNSGALSYTVDGNPVPSGNIQHVTGYKRPGDVIGMSVVTQGRRSLNVGSAGEQYAENFLVNGANPSGVLQVPALPAEASKDIIDRLREQFAARYSSQANAGKPMVLTGGTTWHQISVSPVDAELLSSRRFQVEEIARWFRVPPHMIGDVEKSTSWGTGIEQQALGFVRFTLTPWIVRLEQADSRLLTRPQHLRYNVNSLVRADLATRFQAYTLARNGGWMSANDVRALEDELPIDNGDVYLQPLNYAEAGTEPTTPEAVDVSSPDMPGVSDGPQ